MGLVGVPCVWSPLEYVEELPAFGDIPNVLSSVTPLEGVPPPLTAHVPSSFRNFPEGVPVNGTPPFLVAEIVGSLSPFIVPVVISDDE